MARLETLAPRGDQQPHRATSPRRQRSKGSKISTVLMILGILVLLAPVVLTKLHNAEQLRIAEQYSASVETLSPDERDAQLQRAHQWNATIGDLGIHDPWRQAPDVDSPQYKEYLGVLGSHAVMARLRIPAIGVDLPVYHGSTEEVLAHGAGHIFGSAFPVGGVGTHAAITGHTGVSTSTMFDNLNKVKVGDTFSIETLGTRVAYQVDEITVVLPEEVEYLRPVAGKDYVTLVTCTPYGINSHRLLVRGERLPDEHPAITEESNTNQWQWWMILAMGAAAIGALTLLIGKKPRKNAKEES